MRFAKATFVAFLCFASFERDKLDQKGGVAVADRPPVSSSQEIDSNLVGTWRGRSTDHQDREYQWELRLEGNRRFSLRLSGGKLKDTETITGTWIERIYSQRLITLFAEVAGSYIFPYACKESEADGVGYTAIVRELQSGEHAFYFGCCDYLGVDHRLVATKVEQADAG